MSEYLALWVLFQLHVFCQPFSSKFRLGQQNVTKHLPTWSLTALKLTVANTQKEAESSSIPIIFHSLCLSVKLQVGLWFFPWHLNGGRSLWKTIFNSWYVEIFGSKPLPKVSPFNFWKDAKHRNHDFYPPFVLPVWSKVKISYPWQMRRCYPMPYGRCRLKQGHLKNL